jgi:ABC-type tungstate transport system substrate-binding protein
VCVVITIAIVMLLIGFGPYGIFMTLFTTTTTVTTSTNSGFPIILDW